MSHTANPSTAFTRVSSRTRALTTLGILSVVAVVGSCDGSDETDAVGPGSTSWPPYSGGFAGEGKGTGGTGGSAGDATGGTGGSAGDATGDTGGSAGDGTGGTGGSAGDGTGGSAGDGTGGVGGAGGAGGSPTPETGTPKTVPGLTALEAILRIPPGFTARSVQSPPAPCTEDGQRCFVSNYGSNTLTVVSWPDPDAVPTIDTSADVGAGPVGIDVATLGGTPVALSTGFADNSVHFTIVIDGSTTADESLILSNCNNPGHAVFLEGNELFAVTCYTDGTYLVEEVPPSVP
jgi:hypothetical protein